MWRVLFVATVAIATCLSLPALACNCDDDTLQIPVQSSQLEVWGVARAVAPNANGTLVRLQVYDISYDKDGRKPQEIIVQDPQFCGVGFKEGRTYWVRGIRDSIKEQLYHTNICTKSRETAVPPEYIDGARADLERVESKSQKKIERALLGAEPCKDPDKPFESFAISVAPGDDPLIQQPGFALKKKRRPDCLAEQMVEAIGEVVDPEQSMLIAGTRLLDRPMGFVDVWGCEDPPGCRSFAETLQERLLEVEVPLTEQQARTLAKQMHSVTDRDPSIDIARTLCRLDGVEAAEQFARNNKLVGGQRWDRQLETMLFECNVATRDFDKARTFLQTTNPGPAFALAFRWVTNAEGSNLPVRKDAPTIDAALEGMSLRAARQAFLRSELWENDPLMLEAFAETIAADPDAPVAIRRLGALAYHKAALLLPSAADAYRQFARELAPDDDLADALGKLRAAHAESASANQARTSLAQRSAAEEVAQLNLDAPQTNQAQENTRRGPILKDDADDGLDLDWGSLALHLLVVVGALSAVAFLASRGRS